VKKNHVWFSCIFFLSEVESKKLQGIGPESVEGFLCLDYVHRSSPKKTDNVQR